MFYFCQVLDASRTTAAAKKLEKLAKKGGDKDVKKQALKKDKAAKAKAKSNCQPAADTGAPPAPEAPEAAAAAPAAAPAAPPAQQPAGNWLQTDIQLHRRNHRIIWIQIAH